MQIDWLTVAAQIVNFLVLVWLLQHFLYGPVTRAMARREERIADRVESARAREAAAEHEREELQARKERLVAEGDAILDDAREDAAAEKQRLLDEARAEVDDARERWHRQLRDEQDDFLRQLRRDTTEGFAALARKAFSDLADATLEDRMVETLGARLSRLDEAERDAFRAAGDLEVSTGFGLDEDRRERLTALVREHLDTDAEPGFEQDPELVCGIALTAGGRRLAWSLEDYLDDFERRLAERLDRGRPQAAGAEEPAGNQAEEAAGSDNGPESEARAQQQAAGGFETESGTDEQRASEAATS
jgi:F-type H+-transporting ATPase subunit b